MPPLTNMLISASAGTGKTYQLSLRFLGLLALNSGNHPERLIAITFTRKAAGEFKDRILTDLAAGATDEAGAARLKERLWAVIKGTDGESLARRSGGMEGGKPASGTLPPFTAHPGTEFGATQPLHH